MYVIAIFNRHYLMIEQELDNYSFIIRQLLSLSIQPVYDIKVNRAIYSNTYHFMTDIFTLHWKKFIPVTRGDLS